MTVELSAVRLISPFFGTSNYIWTNIIGVILASLSIGYFVGGKLADKKPRIEVLCRILVLAGIILIGIPFCVKPICQWLIPSGIIDVGTAES